jgi:hypothetical protein
VTSPRGRFSLKVLIPYQLPDIAGAKVLINNDLLAKYSSSLSYGIFISVKTSTTLNNKARGQPGLLVIGPSISILLSRTKLMGTFLLACK